MDILYSCRNCIQNSGQSVFIGKGSGFCLLHNSLICDSDLTTCKYLHRKDLPFFVVDEGQREHAAEFSGFSNMVDLNKKTPIQKTEYSQKYVWENRKFDAITNTLAQYHKSEPAWIFVEAFSGGLDGRRSLVYSSLIRRYMNHCGTWESSYRLLLEFVSDIARDPLFDNDDINCYNNVEDTKSEALWDVVFSRLSCLQEYGFHAGMEEFMWITDSLNGSLTSFDWNNLKTEMNSKKDIWIDAIIAHAREAGVFFKMQVIQQ